MTNFQMWILVLILVYYKVINIKKTEKKSLSNLQFQLSLICGSSQKGVLM